ncbi:MAG: hypothetical protein U1E17_08145 [Geminicoccaceae bacterium]
MTILAQRSVSAIDGQRRLPKRLLPAVLLAMTPWLVHASPAKAASSTGCEGGGFTVAGTTGSLTLPGNSLGAAITVVGRYVTFTIVPATFEIRDWRFTGAANPLDLTGGQNTPIWERRTPDHRGLILSSDVQVQSDGPDLVVSRTGPGLSMTVQAKDCAQGGIFQVEPQRADGTATRFTHVLAPSVFYFDNPNFRAREGDALPYKDTTVTVTPRINIAGDVSARLVARDSTQVATRVNDVCNNQIRNRIGVLVTVFHCGHRSIWDVASGGRMGFVTGEDATEVAPPATVCTSKCQAQNRVRGRAVNLGFPFPVPAASRLVDPAS